MHDVRGRLVFANQVYQKLMGLKESELKKAPPRDLKARLEERFREPDLGELEGRFLLDGGNVVETTGAGKVPEQRLFYRSTAPVRDGRGETIGGLVVYRDVSKEIEAEQMKAEVLRLRTELETTYSFFRHGGHQPRNAAGIRADEAGRRKRYHGAHTRRERHRQGVGGQVVSLQRLAKEGGRSLPSIAPPSPQR